MARVFELHPGDLVADPLGGEHLFVAHCPHPIFAPLQLVIWRMADGGWSFDALATTQEVGDPKPSAPADRESRLRQVLLGGDA